MGEFLHELPCVYVAVQLQQPGLGCRCVVGMDNDATDGMATSMIMSAISASLSRVVASGVEARTIRTLWGSLRSSRGCQQEGGANCGKLR